MEMNIEKALGLSGISYVIYTTEGEFARQNQPCYGELRKYERTHVGECTQPANSKPGDLHSPFPDGTPTGILVPFPGVMKSPETDVFYKAIFSKDSPWYSGFKDVEFFKDKKGFIAGIVITDMDIDPTVMVNCFKTIQGMFPVIAKEFVKLLEFGLTETEALAVRMLNGGYSVINGAMNTDAYKAPAQFSARRFFERTPNDLTGGVFRDRIDYNRTDMHKPFFGDTKDGAIVWKTTAEAEGFPKYAGYGKTQANWTVKDSVPVIKSIFKKAIENESTPVITPFVWKTTTGKSNEKGDTISYGLKSKPSNVA